MEIVLKDYICTKCGNSVYYDDTPYNSYEWQELEKKFIELACPICGNRLIINED
jgi:DNA-directed RNA polymerase subunit RPC12/RpoP